MTISTVNLGIPPDIISAIQQGTLERVFHDALYPSLLYRAEAMPERWEANLGETMTMSRPGLMAVSTTPLIAGQDPLPGSYDLEQWQIEARQFGGTIDTHMPTSYVAIASLFLRNTVQLGLNAGQTLNRLVRNPLYRAYDGGNSVNIVAVAAAATQAIVASINGFTENLFNARPTPVSSANPLAVSFGNAEPANTVIGAVPLNPADPFGPGIVSFGAALSVGLPLRTGVFAGNRARIIRVGGGATVDAITAANILTLQDVINAVSRMRENNVPPTADGFYHVHMTPTAEAEIFADNQFQRLFQSIPSDSPYASLAIGQLLGCRFYRNREAPISTNVGTLIDTSGGAGSARAASEIGAEVINQAGVGIQRTMIVGGGSIYEKYLDESKYISEAGVTGKVGEFSVVNNGLSIMTDRIRLVLRAPLDKLQQVVSQTWSWSGDFAIPSDALTGSPARFKRAQIIEHS